METENLIQIDKGDDPSESILFSPLTPTLGAEVSGLDVANGVPDSVKTVLKQALLDYQVLLFRQQFLNDEQQIEFAQIFGPCREMWQPEHYRSNSKFIHYLSNVDRDGVPVGIHPDRNSTYWHSDYTHVPVPARATVMNAVQVPEDAGKTHFINMYQQYEYLDQATRDRLGNYEAEHHMGFRRAARNKRLPWQWRQARKEGESILSQLKWWTTTFRRRWQDGPVYHPVVRPHPETGRVALFIGDHAWRIKGMFWPAGIRLMNKVNALEIDPGAVYTHKWKPGDLLIWDNGSLLHRLGEYDLINQVRIMRRCVVLDGE
ncbi:MAG: TauD/TfdA family dioxygenase [Phycisphaeraceae bacterium]|nr:TauD/TfdA family dioxygenase [Phycisphaeraceae bacterium]